MARDLGFEIKVRVRSDACAAIGIASRRGVGRISHLDIKRQHLRWKRTTRQQASGSESRADFATNHVSADLLKRNVLGTHHLKFLEGKYPAARELPPEM